MKVHRPRRIAPRLFGGAPRLHWGGRLPEHVKEGIRAIARRENKSMSWVMEEVVIEFFHLERPRYISDPEPAPKVAQLSRKKAASG